MNSTHAITAHRLLPTSLLLALLLLLSVPASAEPVVLQLKWKHQFQFAGFYMAKEKGYYRDAGLDVEIRQLEPDTDITHGLNNGDYNYLVTDPGILKDAAAGAPVRILAAIFQHSPLALMTLERPDIHKLADLRGKRIMMLPGMSAHIDAALAIAGVGAGDFIRLRNSLDLNDLIDGRTDAFSVYISDQPYQLELKGIHYQLFLPADYGIDFYGDILVTSNDEVLHHAERAQTFTDASMRGWQYALDHIDETIDVIEQKYNPQHLPRAQLLYEAKKAKAMILSDVVQIGYMSHHRWQKIAETYISLGLLPPNFQVDSLIYRPEPGLMDAIKQHIWSITIALFLLTALLLTLHIQRLQRVVRTRTDHLLQREQTNRLLTQRLITTSDDERRFISHELHDELGQSLTAISTLTAMIKGESSQGRVIAHADHISVTVKQLFELVRKILTRINPDMLDTSGLILGLQAMMADWRKITQIEIDFSTAGSMENLSDALNTTLFRIVQESLTNVMRHASASHVSIRIAALENTQKIELEISDDGIGFDMSQSPTGVGLTTIRERVYALKGEYSLHSTPGHGVRLFISLPLRRKQSPPPFQVAAD
ncbi:hypothetical protein FE236_07455 [Mariprofundus erugo]|uniref:Oxygen sensor histidine kinase NreB n=1 Tax=Mariprofundus erugo TaxID=2528639 RepID=A0A5R9GMD2_9PROT|nr:ABC transporter substrate-binding protein [Mariprofundus erugo]TLS67551.1 hypothetical protein FEF65_06435 [Mariprofundus erugo]TLS76215.1 hypothetical protein FE236_07455 [Mariprofundus erugo]